MFDINIPDSEVSHTMTIMQSTRQTLTKSMPLMFDNKNSAWPDPEQSIGKECLSISGLRCWLPIGPALAAFEILSKDLQALLDKHKDALKQGEPKPRAISFNMWMTGSKPESSSPTIVFSSKSPRQRAFAKALLKDSKLLDQYPGVRIKTLDRMPAIYQSGSQQPDTIETTCDSTDNVSNDGSEEAIYMVDDSRGSCGALIAFGRLRLATMGGILLINGTYYGISAQHGRYEFLEELEDATNEGNSLCFDHDSDTENYDLDNLVEITSSESVSSYSDEGSSTLSFASTTSPKDGIFEYPINFPSTTELTLDHTPEVPSPSQPTYSSNPKISNLLPYERNDLDYEVFEIEDPRYHNWNKIDLPSSGHHIRHIFPNKIARTPVECPVWAATGTTGCVQGTMMRQAHYIKMEGSETFQEMWAVKLNRNTKPGDSGAWVVDSAGQLYGHIVAGDPMLGLAFIIPAYKIFDDIKRRFGSEALCCPSSSTMQPYNTLKENVSRSDWSVGAMQTWPPSRTFRCCYYQSLEPPCLTLLMVSVLLSVPLYLPLANYSIGSICLGGVILGTTYTLQIATMCRYMSCRYGIDYPLEGILIRDGHGLQIRKILSFICLGLENPTMVSDLHQYEENVWFWNSRHITSPNFTQVLLTRLLRLIFCNDHPEWQRIVQGGRLTRTIMYVASWGIARTSNAFVKALTRQTSSEIYLQPGNNFTAYHAHLDLPSNVFDESYFPHDRIITPDKLLGTHFFVLLPCGRSTEMLLREIYLPEATGLRGDFSSEDMVLRMVCILRGFCFPIFWCDKELVSEQMELWSCYYWVILFSGLCSGAFPIHDARQFRRRRLNAPRQREDNSQCSESRERER